MGTLRLYQEAEWVRFGDCSCLKECQCTHFLVHQLSPSAFRDLTKKHQKIHREKWPDGWREVTELADSFTEEYVALTTLGWRNVVDAAGVEIPFTPENLLLVREHTGLRFQKFMNELLEGHQTDAQEIKKAELGNSNPG